MHSPLLLLRNTFTIPVQMPAGFPTAFDGEGWTLKTDPATKQPVLSDGKPVYLKPDGSEVVFDINQTQATIARLGNEAKTHREAAQAATEKLKVFEGLDPAKAREALDTVGKLDAKKLIDAGKVDEVRAEMTKTFQAQIDEANKKVAGLTDKYNSTLLANAFASSKFVTEKLAIPAEMVQATFGNRFKVGEDGKISAVGIDGNPLYSKDRIGEPATFDEAISQIIDSYPHKATILKGNGQSGSGATPPGTPPGMNVVKRSDFEKMAATEQARIAGEAKAGKAQIVD